MVCLVLTALIDERGEEFADEVLQAVRELLPPSMRSNKDLTLERLVGMQSGLRDYWALSVLWGATPQDRFSIYQDAPKALMRLGGFHFAPGTQMSYCNTNFMVVGLAIEKATGRTLSDLLDEQIFHPEGMKTAALRPDTARIPQPLVGYEGSEETGYIPYSNRIEWAGDAGVHASLEDMIAYEKFIHHSALSENSIYFRNAREPKYIDDEPANYGHGLFHSKIGDIKVIWHSGGLAGFRLRRVYVPSQQLSVIVLLNSETDTKAVAEHILKKVIALQAVEQLSLSDNAPATKIDVKWTGNYFDNEVKVAVTVKQDKPGEIKVNYDGHDEELQVRNESEAGSVRMQIRHENGSLSIKRPFDHRNFVVRSLEAIDISSDAKMFQGKYYSADVDSTFHVSGSGAMLYGAFDGYLGKGPIHVMRRLGENVWWLACFRSLDAPTPGHWTVAFETEQDSTRITGVTVGCWLARNVRYKKVE